MSLSWLPRFLAAALLTASASGVTASPAGGRGEAARATAAPIGRYRLHSVGVWGHFEQFGANQALLPGDIIKQFDQIDPVAGMRTSDEVAIQMDAMRSLGINIFTFPLITTAPVYQDPGFPRCAAPPAIGLLYPAPTAQEITNLGRFLDLASTKGLRVILRLVNNHEDDLTGSATWLDALFSVVKAHPNVDLISLDGDLNTIDTNGDGIADDCGGVSEPPLFRGVNSPQAQYVKWAIQRGMAAGIEPRRLSAEAIVGAYIYFYQSPITLPGYQDGHAWDPVFVEKQIFDSLAIPDAERTYDLSFYEVTRCGVLQGCDDEPAAAWTEQVADRISQVVGTGNGARVLAAEMGVGYPVNTAWQSTRALENLADVMEAHAFDGGAFWTWVAPNMEWQNDPAREQDVLRLGTSIVYNPVAAILEDMGGFHLAAIPNGSFESGGSTPDHWYLEGVRRRRASRHMAVVASMPAPSLFQRLDLSAEAGEPDVPTRGRYALRLSTGDPADASSGVVSDPIAVTPGTEYTTAMALRFAWSGDPNPQAPAAMRPNVSIGFEYFDPDGNPVTVRPADVFRRFQEDSTSGFTTFVFRYTPPDGASSVRIEIAAHRNGLGVPIVVDADAVR